MNKYILILSVLVVSNCMKPGFNTNFFEYNQGYIIKNVVVSAPNMSENSRKNLIDNLKEILTEYDIEMFSWDVVFSGHNKLNKDKSYRLLKDFGIDSILEIILSDNIDGSNVKKEREKSISGLKRSQVPLIISVQTFPVTQIINTISVKMDRTFDLSIYDVKSEMRILNGRMISDNKNAVYSSPLIIIKTFADELLKKLKKSGFISENKLE